MAWLYRRVAYMLIDSKLVTSYLGLVESIIDSTETETLKHLSMQKTVIKFMKKHRTP